MLEELIKLSKELFEMELVKESLEIDGLIHKLYGVGGDIDAPVLREADDTVLYSESQSLSEDLRYLLTASKEEEFMLELRKRDRERKLISKIEQSMKDLSDNMYGFCDTCGIEIGIKRLEARPTATQCIDCKTIEEIKEKQQYG